MKESIPIEGSAGCFYCNSVIADVKQTLNFSRRASNGVSTIFEGNLNVL